MKKPKKSAKRLTTMRTHEMAEATAAYGREMAIEKFGPLSKTARDRWDRARRRPGRPRRGQGARVVSVSVEQDLLDRSDRLAERLGVSRARLIEQGLKIVLAKVPVEIYSPKRKAELLVATAITRADRRAAEKVARKLDPAKGRTGRRNR